MADGRTPLFMGEQGDVDRIRRVTESALRAVQPPIGRQTPYDRLPWRGPQLFAPTLFGTPPGRPLSWPRLLPPPVPVDVVGAPEPDAEERIARIGTAGLAAWQGVTSLGGARGLQASTLPKDPMAGWVYLLRQMGAETDVGRSCQGEAGERLVHLVHAILEGKAPSTLAKRLTAQQQFAAHVAATEGAVVSPWPFTLARANVYLEKLAVAGAAPTRGRSFRESLAFLDGHFGCRSAQAVLTDRVNRSLSLGLLRKKAEARCAPPLPACVVREFELFVCEASPSPDVVFLGSVLYCLYTRTRWGDISRLEVEPVLNLVDNGVDGLLEASTRIHKSARCAPDRALPLVAPARGVAEKPWAAAWLRARAHCGIRANPKTGLLPAIRSGQVWGSRRMSTSDAVCFLRRFLTTMSSEAKANLGQAFLGPDAYSAHSLKPTTLAWCAAAEVDIRVRRILGYHVERKDRLAVLYSRDAIQGAIRALTRVLAQIRAGAFDPDSTRASLVYAPAASSKEGLGDFLPAETLLPMETAQPEGPEGNLLSAEQMPPVENPLSSPLDDAAASSSGGSDFESDAVTSDEDTGEHDLGLAGDPEWVLNVRSGVLHTLAYDGSIVCGRRWPLGAQLVPSPPSDADRCLDCLRDRRRRAAIF